MQQKNGQPTPGPTATFDCTICGRQYALDDIHRTRDEICRLTAHPLQTNYNKLITLMHLYLRIWNVVKQWKFI